MSIHALSRQSELFKQAAQKASEAMSKWLGRPTRITINAVSSLPLAEAEGLLGSGDVPLVACVMQIRGMFSGLLVLTSDDSGGLSLADLLLGRESGSSREWTEIERSAAIETANIIGCAYLNSMASDPATGAGQADGGLLPTPPMFLRDYAAAVMEGILMVQASHAENIFFTHTALEVDRMPGRCSLLFIPEADSGA